MNYQEYLDLCAVDPNLELVRVEDGLSFKSAKRIGVRTGRLVKNVAPYAKRSIQRAGRRLNYGYENHVTRPLDAKLTRVLPKKMVPRHAMNMFFQTLKREDDKKQHLIERWDDLTGMLGEASRGLKGIKGEFERAGHQKIANGIANTWNKGFAYPHAERVKKFREWGTNPFPWWYQ